MRLCELIDAKHNIINHVHGPPAHVPYYTTAPTICATRIIRLFKDNVVKPGMQSVLSRQPMAKELLPCLSPRHIDWRSHREAAAMVVRQYGFAPFACFSPFANMSSQSLPHYLLSANPGDYLRMMQKGSGRRQSEQTFIPPSSATVTSQVNFVSDAFTTRDTVFAVRFGPFRNGRGVRHAVNM